MFDPRQRMMGGRPQLQRPAWLQQLGQGLAAQPGGGWGGGQPGAWPPPRHESVTLHKQTSMFAIPAKWSPLR